MNNDEHTPDELHGEPAWFVALMLLLFALLAGVSVCAGYLCGLCEAAWRAIRR